MKPIQVEAWARRVVERVVAGQPIEDTRVELKAKWIEPPDAARRIAGHANASRGSDVLWVFGVDERAQTVPGVDANDWATWWSQIEAEFEGGAVPVPTEVNVLHDDVTLVAVYLDTSLAPYVVKTHNEKVPYEVPWRDGTRVRTARRADLVLLLSDVAELPQVDQLDGTASAGLRESAPGEMTVYVGLEVYVHARAAATIVFPRHLVDVSCHFESEEESRELRGVELRSRRTNSIATWTDDELVLSGPALITVDARGNHLDLPTAIPAGRLFVQVSMLPSGGDLPLTIHSVLRQTEGASSSPEGEWTSWGKWELDTDFETPEPPMPMVTWV